MSEGSTETTRAIQHFRTCRGVNTSLSQSIAHPFPSDPRF